MDKFERFEKWLRENGADFQMVRLITRFITSLSYVVLFFVKFIMIIRLQPIRPRVFRHNLLFAIM